MSAQATRFIAYAPNFPSFLPMTFRSHPSHYLSVISASHSTARHDRPDQTVLLPCAVAAPRDLPSLSGLAAH